MLCWIVCCLPAPKADCEGIQASYLFKSFAVLMPFTAWAFATKTNFVRVKFLKAVTSVMTVAN